MQCKKKHNHMYQEIVWLLTSIEKVNDLVNLINITYLVLVHVYINMIS